MPIGLHWPMLCVFLPISQAYATLPSITNGYTKVANERNPIKTQCSVAWRATDPIKCCNNNIAPINQR